MQVPEVILPHSLGQREEMKAGRGWGRKEILAVTVAGTMRGMVVGWEPRVINPDHQLEGPAVYDANQIYSLACYTMVA